MTNREQFEPKVRELERDWPYGNLAMLRSFLNEAFDNGQAAAYRKGAKHFRKDEKQCRLSAEIGNRAGYADASLDAADAAVFQQCAEWLESQAKKLEAAGKAEEKL